MEPNKIRKMGLIEIRAEHAHKWREWGARLMSSEYAEAIASLKEEGLTEETVSLIELDGKTYLCFYAEGAALPANLDRPVSAAHKELLDHSRVRKIEGTIIYSLSNDQ